MKQFGITPPISVDTPTQLELQRTDELNSILHEMGVYESDAESKLREVVLSRLNLLVKQFVRKVAIDRNLPESVAEEAGGKIYTFGSYRLGVHGAGADIDTLCVVPRFVQREDFFGTFKSMLEECSDVTKLTPVPDSYVPLIGIEFSGIPIDLVFARLNLSSIRENLDLKEDSLIKNLDERDVRSLNGSRVTDEILRLVPDIATFRLTLRCIKLWAKRRGIYSNIMGFFGGVAWAMCVARVCQLFPNATASVVVAKFFKIMGMWQWPQPVLLKPLEELPMGLRVWNPKNHLSDRAHRMPVITPAYPSMCATHNITASTLNVMVEELNLASEVAERIMDGTAHNSWNDLFQEHNFFYRYKYYLQVIASSSSEECQLVWSSMVESKIRHLVQKLEFVDGLLLAHPFVKGFAKTIACATNEEAISAVRGILPSISTSNPISPDVPCKTVFTTTFYIGLQVEKQQGNGLARKLDISYPTTEFTKLCKNWESYVDTAMGICVKYLRSVSLPDDLFENGKRVPKKKSKRSQVEEDSMPKRQKSVASVESSSPKQ